MSTMRGGGGGDGINCTETCPLVANHRGSLMIPRYVNCGGGGQSLMDHPCDVHQTPPSSPGYRRRERSESVFSSGSRNYTHEPWTWCRWAKVAGLMSVVLFALGAFMMVNETKETPFLVIIKDQTPKYLNLTNELDIMSPVWTIKARGPFIPDELDNLTEYHVYFSIVETDENRQSRIVLDPWIVPIAPPQLITHLNTRIVEHSFNMKQSYSSDKGYDKSSIYKLRISTTLPDPAVLSITTSTFTELSLRGIFMSCVILAFLYILIIFEVVERTLAAMLGSTVAIACLTIINNRPSLEKIISWLDIETLALLFGMMVMVAILCETGFFDYVAVLAFRLARGRVWPLIIILCLFTAVLSAFLDNVTTVLLMTPITIRLCEIKRIDPKHVLIAQVIFSNIGGAATPVGDPPNVIIINSPRINQMGVNFTSFTAHVMPGVVVCIFATIILLRYMYRDTEKLRAQTSGEHLIVGRKSDLECIREDDPDYPASPSSPARPTSTLTNGISRDSHYLENLNINGPNIYRSNVIKQSSVEPVQHRVLSRENSLVKASTELKREIEVWKKAKNSIVGYSKDEVAVRDVLRKKVNTLERIMSKEMSEVVPEEANLMSDICELTEKYHIRNRPLLIKAGCVMAVVIVLFFLQTIPQLDLSLGWIAILGAVSILILADFEELESIFRRVEWSTLIFFASLFVVMEALSELKLLLFIGQLTRDAICYVSVEHRLVAAIMLILWVSAFASSFIDNIPFATVMVKVVEDLAKDESLQIPMTPLVYALAFGACLGGNGTLIGASANVVCAGVAEQHGYRFTFMDFFRVGFPIMLLTVAIANVYLLLCHVVFQMS
ncbi:P protein-like isoform X1 [Brevipalpus obovatus]|uniref:P protein-like isoform X1 n=1 Tax=Brevipalpus obovatus TaxID=246614 RepID=UPI003D9E07CB